MILVDYQIKDLCDRGLVAPFDTTLINPASLDVRIGYSAITENLLDDSPALETFQGAEILLRDNIEWSPIDLTLYSKGSPYWIQPKEFILVATLESVNIPDDIVGELKIKSSRAREGYDNALAFHLDPSYHGIPTLELINQCRYTPLPIYPGLRIGQIIFSYCSIPHRPYSVTGRYNNSTSVEASKG